MLARLNGALRGVSSRLLGDFGSRAFSNVPRKARESSGQRFKNVDGARQGFVPNIPARQGGRLKARHVVLVHHESQATREGFDDGKVSLAFGA